MAKTLIRLYPKFDQNAISHGKEHRLLEDANGHGVAPTHADGIVEVVTVNQYWFTVIQRCHSWEWAAMLERDA